MGFVRHLFVRMGAALLVSAAGAAFGTAPLQLEAFDVEQVPRLAPGTRLNFSLFGTAGATATLRIEGVRNPLALAETEPGVYEGSHTIDERDRIQPAAHVVATLRRGVEAASIVLAEPLQLGASAPVVVAAPSPSASPSRSPPPPPPRRSCLDCAVVESIREVVVRDRSDPVGAVVGAVLGALLGGEIGEGDDRDFTRVAGAVGGALIGHEVDRSRGARRQYEVVLRRPDGASLRRRYDRIPSFKVGDTVRVGPDVR